MRIVSAEEWNLSQHLDPARRQRLLNPPPGDDLLTHLLDEASQAACGGRVRLSWQQSDEATSYFRAIALLPVSECTFDQLFNGLSGYRAQHYLSPEEGVIFNRKILDGLVPAIRAAYERNPLNNVPFDWVEHSLRAPHPRRWVDSGAARGRRVPLPDHSTIDVKGAFIRPGTNDMYVDELKLERPCDLHRGGYT